MTGLRAALRQPLVIFCLLGAVVFVVDTLLTHRTSEIHVSRGVRSEVRAQLARTLGRPPTDDEAVRGLEEWLDTELLFREAMALGLHENDAVIRAHLASKLGHIVRERTIAVEPTEAELALRLQTHPERYSSPDTFDLTHAFVRKLPSAVEERARIDDALTRLRAGAEPRTVGDHFPRGPTFTRMSQAQLAPIFGAELSEVLRRERVGQWQAVPGSRGTHLLRVDAVHQGAGDVGAAREALVQDLHEQQKEAALREFTRELRKKYEVANDAE